MEDNGNNAGFFESTYNKLTYPEDISEDDQSFNLNQERQQGKWQEDEWWLRKHV